MARAKFFVRFSQVSGLEHIHFRQFLLLVLSSIKYSSLDSQIQSENDYEILGICDSKNEIVPINYFYALSFALQI